MSKDKKKPAGEYDVGRNKPPKHTQFQKGESGNPGGRPKGSKNTKTIINKLLEERVAVTSNGKTKKVSAREAMIMRLREKALSGDQRAIENLTSLALKFEDSGIAGEEKLSRNDQAILDDYVKWQIGKKDALHSKDVEDGQTSDADEGQRRDKNTGSQPETSLPEGRSARNAEKPADPESDAEDDSWLDG